MLIEFSIGNFRSIKEIQTLSFVATSINEHKNNTFKTDDKNDLLKSVGIYGANGSGKSNLVKGIWLMQHYVLASFGDKKKIASQIEPFLFNTETQNAPTFFQIIFVFRDKKYRYGYEIQKGIIQAEWLFGTAEKNEAMYFTREKQSFSINKNRFKEGFGLENRCREDNLFLNVSEEFNGNVSKTIAEFFESKIEIFRNNNSLMESANLQTASIAFLENSIKKKKLMQLIHWADENTLDLISTENEEHLKKKLGFIENPNELLNTPISNLLQNPESNFLELILMNGGLDDMGLSGLQSAKKVLDKNGNLEKTILIDFESEASEGTKLILKYAGLILSSLENGNCLIFDEFESKLHPILTKKIIELFNSNTNKNAQLFFVTHDTNLLDNSLLRRDQIYFAEKNKQNATEIYALSDIKGTRNDATFEKDYFKGKYGAIPYIGDISKLFSLQNYVGKDLSWNKRPQTKRNIGQSYRAINNTFLIYCEGENTEPNYFKEFRMKADTQVIPVGTGRTKTSLVKFALKDLSKRGRDKDTQVWLVFDYDLDLKKSNQKEDFKEAMRLSAKNKLEVAYSIDCFELWFLLHFQFSDVAMHRTQLYELMSKYFNNDYENIGKSKSESKQIYQYLLDKQPIAIRNAEKLYQIQSELNQKEQNPVTTVFELVKEMNRFLR